ncbi:MAG: hemolysin family protein [Cellulosilyticaceae bacterium]
MEAGPSSHITVQMILILVLVLVNAFFAAAEVAILSVNKNRMTELIELGDRRASLLQRVVENPTNVLSTIQMATTFTGLFAVAWIATSMADNISEYIGYLNVPYSYEIAIISITLAFSYIVLVIGQLVPKHIARQKPEEIALRLVTPIYIIAKIMTPIAKLLSASTYLIVKVFKLAPKQEEEVSEEDIKYLITKGEESGVINETAKEMLYGVFEFSDKVATEVMIPRLEVVMVNIESPKENILSKVLTHKFSRIPVYRENKHNILGVLQTKDFLEEVIRVGLENVDVEGLIKPAYFVPETKSVETLFKELQKSKNHMAILIDEYGDFAGIVTIENIVEEIVGDIVGEHDEGDQDICQIDDSTYIVDGLTHIDDVNKYLDIDIECENFDTIGGFVVNLLGNIPRNSQKVSAQYKDIVFEVDKVKSNRVEKLKIYMPKEIAV